MPLHPCQEEHCAGPQLLKSDETTQVYSFFCKKKAYLSYESNNLLTNKSVGSQQDTEESDILKSNQINI